MFQFTSVAHRASKSAAWSSGSTDGLDGIGDAVEDGGFHPDRHVVLGDQVLRRDVGGVNLQVDQTSPLHERDDQNKARPAGASQVPYAEDHQSLVLPHDPDCAQREHDGEQANDAAAMAAMARWAWLQGMPPPEPPEADFSAERDRETRFREDSGGRPGGRSVSGPRWAAE